MHSCYATLQRIYLRHNEIFWYTYNYEQTTVLLNDTLTYVVRLYNSKSRQTNMFRVSTNVKDDRTIKRTRTVITRSGAKSKLERAGTHWYYTANPLLSYAYTVSRRVNIVRKQSA